MVLFLALLAAYLDAPSTQASGTPCANVELGDVVGWWRGSTDLDADVGTPVSGDVEIVDALVATGFAPDGDDVLRVERFPAVSTAVSVETWVKPVDTDQAQALMGRWQHLGSDDSARSYSLVLAGEHLVWLTDEPTLRRPLELRAPAASIFDGRFHHVAATWDSSRVALYIDGVAVASVRSQGGVLNPAPATPFQLASSAGGASFLTGVLDEPTVFRRALTPAEVAAVHAAGSAGKCGPGEQPPPQPDASGEKLGVSSGGYRISTDEAFTTSPATEIPTTSTIVPGPSTTSTTPTTVAPTSGALWSSDFESTAWKDSWKLSMDSYATNRQVVTGLPGNSGKAMQVTSSSDNDGFTGMAR